MSTHQTAKTHFVSNGDIEYAYRRFGKDGGVPLMCLIHFHGNMDLWDPLLINKFAVARPVILFDNAGVGKSSGTVGVDLLGFSTGGFVAQLVALNAPAGQIRRFMLTGTGPSAGDGVVRYSIEQQQEVGRLAGHAQPGYDKSPYRLFLDPSETSQAANRAYWQRVNERTAETSGEERSNFVSWNFVDGGAGVKAMVTAGQAFANPTQAAPGSFDRLSEITIPVFIGQGHNDSMIPAPNSFLLQQRLPNARLKIWLDSGHGFLYQYEEELAEDVNRFLYMA